MSEADMGRGPDSASGQDGSREEPRLEGGGEAAQNRITIIGQRVYEPVRISPEKRDRLRARFGQDPYVLIFSPDSCAKLKERIGWGERTGQNRVEQGGILLGRVWRHKGEVFSYLEDCALADTRGSAAFVEFTAQMWSAMQQELDELNSRRPEDDRLAIIGWFHTHPNDLSVFMSGTDRSTQDRNFAQDWQVSLVLNPHKRVLRAFFGKEIREGRVIGWDSGQSSPPDRSAKAPQRESPPEPGRGADSEPGQNTGSGAGGPAGAPEPDSQVKNRRIWLNALFLVMGLGAGYFTGSRSGAGGSPPEKAKSTVLFSVTCQAGTSQDVPLVCAVEVRGTTSEGVPHTSRHLVECNSDEAFITLEAGTYEVSFVSLPAVPDGAGFEDASPVALTVDGVKPRLVTVRLVPKAPQEPPQDGAGEAGGGDGTAGRGIRRWLKG